MRNNIGEEIKNYAKLNDDSSFCIIACWILENIDKIEKITITSLSEKTNTSPSTITRFCQALGFSGFKNFKYFLIWERDDFLVWNKLQVTNESHLPSLSALDKNINDFRNNLEKFNKAANLILKHKKIYIYGFGGNNHLIKIFQNYLVRLNINAIYLQDRDDQTAYSQLTNQNNLNVIVSYKFRDSRWEKIFQNLRKNQSPCLIICKKNENNAFIQHHDFVLDFHFSEGFEFYRDNSEISMLTILLLIIERIVILDKKQKLLKKQDVW